MFMDTIIDVHCPTRIENVYICYLYLNYGKTGKRKCISRGSMTRSGHGINCNIALSNLGAVSLGAPFLVQSIPIWEPIYFLKALVKCYSDLQLLQTLIQWYTAYNDTLFNFTSQFQIHLTMDINLPKLNQQSGCINTFIIYQGHYNNKRVLKGANEWIKMTARVPFQ